MGLTTWLASRKDIPVPRPLNTWAIVVAVTRSPGLNQELERASGALPTTMLDIPFRMEQM